MKWEKASKFHTDNGVPIGAIVEHVARRLRSSKTLTSKMARFQYSVKVG